MDSTGHCGVSVQLGRDDVNKCNIGMVLPVTCKDVLILQEPLVCQAHVHLLALYTSR